MDCNLLLVKVYDDLLSVDHGLAILSSLQQMRLIVPSKISISFFTYFAFLPILLRGQTGQHLEFSFQLDKPATVSAGLYNGEHLIRTIFSNKHYEAGSFTERFEPLDDEIRPIKNKTGLSVKVLSNNVKYEWEGVIGNTSQLDTGRSVFVGYNSFNYIQVANNMVYFTNGYSEGGHTQNFFSLDDIQVKHSIFAEEGKGIGQNSVALATDGKLVYWAGFDPFIKQSAKPNFVFASKVSDNSEEIFTLGKNYKMAVGRNYKSVIDFTKDSLLSIKGIAVQRQGNLLFVSHGNTLHVLNKKTGELIKKISIHCAGLAIDVEDNLWVIDGKNVVKYLVSNESLNRADLVLDQFENPLSIAISPDNDIIAVADAGESSQQVKAFDIATGAQKWILGQKGGYFENAFAVNDKFYFSDKRKNYGGSLSFQSDGSFWLVDGGNYRVMHFSKDRKFLESVMFLPHMYTIFVDPNQPQRVFADFMEFRIDYSKPLRPGNDAWKFVANWGAEITGNEYYYLRSFMPVTLKNRKTYSPIYNKSDRIFDIVELTGNGKLRKTGKSIPASGMIARDGHLYIMPGRSVGNELAFQEKKLVSFDAKDNPIWQEGEVIASINHLKKVDPRYSGTLNQRAGQVTQNNILLVFNGDTKTEGFHLGGLKLGDSAWTWLTAHSTPKGYSGPFPSDGSYDIGNGVQYGGNVALAEGTSIFWGYHGEFWKSSQTNMWNHLDESGLMLGQFGITGPEVASLEAPAQMAGNVINASVTRVGDAIYLYHNDEGRHSGIHRWKVSNLNSIHVQDVEFRNVNPKKNLNSWNLLDCVEKKTLEIHSSQNCWKRFPLQNVSNKQRERWSVSSNRKNSDLFSSPDLTIQYSHIGNDSAYVTRQLPPVTGDFWKMSGSISYPNNMPSGNRNSREKLGGGGQLFEVLDKSGKVIIEFFPFRDYKSRDMSLLVNQQEIIKQDAAQVKKMMNTFQPFSIVYEKGKLSFSYGSFKVDQLSPIDNGAKANEPASIRLFFWSNGKNLSRSFSVQKLIFDVK